MHVFQYRKNEKIEHYKYTCLSGLFIQDMDYYRNKLNIAHQRASSANRQIIEAKIKLTQAFKNEPHSEHLKQLKEEYHKIKLEWKEASDEVISTRYWLNCAYRAYARFRFLYPNINVEENLVDNHYRRKKHEKVNTSR